MADLRSIRVETLADPLFTFLPKRPRALRIERVRTYTAPDALAIDDLRDMTVLAITAADHFRFSDAGGPRGCCCTLRNALPAEGRSALGLTGIDFRNHFRRHVGRHVPTQLGMDRSRVHRRRPHTLRL